MFFDKKWGISIKKESESLEFTGLEIPREYYKNQEVTITGSMYPNSLVKSKFLKINYSQVEYVMDCLGKNTTKVHNIKSYLLTKSKDVVYFPLVDAEIERQK